MLFLAFLNNNRYIHVYERGEKDPRWWIWIWYDSGGDVTTRVNMKIHEVEQVSIQRNIHSCVLLILASFLNFFRRVPQTPKAKNCDLIKTRKYHVHDTLLHHKLSSHLWWWWKNTETTISHCLKVWYAQKLIRRELQCLFTIICGLKGVFNVNTWQMYKSVYVHIL